MEPQQKASELFNKFFSQIKEYPSEYYDDDIERQTAKLCAIILCDEIRAAIDNNDEWIPEYSEYFFQFWYDVKKEIEKL